ncbi:hypothetical protein K1719_014287 [Acacia pycnantha]|nr:hypothetical protein K1719_014287 [Acacia pycnantha]
MANEFGESTSTSSHGMHRSTARQRLEAPLAPEANPFGNSGFGLMGGYIPTATARMRIFSLSKAFGGFIPLLLNIQFHGFPYAPVYRTTSGYTFGFNAFHGGHARDFAHTTTS